MECSVCHKHARYLCGHGCETPYCGELCARAVYDTHRKVCSDLVGCQQQMLQNPSHQIAHVLNTPQFVGAFMNLESIRVDPKVLGEGGFGCVIKSADGRYAIKVQEESSSEACVYEAQVQENLLAKVPNAAVARVYFYKSNIQTIPWAWRATLQGGCQKASKWASQNWYGRFCITVMDFLTGGPPKTVSRKNFPLFCFSLLYTVDQGYARFGFQHLDIKVENLILIPQSRGQETYQVGSSTFVFTGITGVPRMVDFGLSYTDNAPASVNVLKFKGATLMITPFEVVVSRIQPKIPPIRDYMYTTDGKRYHWSYDLFSIGMTILSAGFIPRQGGYIGMRFIQDSTPYAFALASTRYGHDRTGPAVQQALMVLEFMFNLCIIQYLLGNGSYPDIQDGSFAKVYPPGTIGYDLLFTPENRRVIDWIVSRNTSIYAQDIQYFTQTYGQSATKLVASLLHWNPEKRGGGKGQVLNHPYFSRFVRK